ncbi:23S rRNA (adenine(1618)-N(6))-methyltransferase RlmF [Hymenobacter caeli]|uniref:Ribosomal RNA large subunit methyltransferase F n=1 Tax=Hymenobacter caeli TaxID=2735894 RepID=A0ABX2FMY9_9BACT|nr:23S rRNA (adenine(1618)-N(6))-methyltransferase RlmF [Hymenobacter caeli]NRT17810.1 23S rRNA (adenine1618-N6)-methyltransferase [Hymenobacter caeli]
MPPPERPSKDALHPRNRHRGRYDFPQLIKSSPALAGFVRANPFGDQSVDFADPAAVKALNQALLRHFYGVDYWDLPAGYLCPPIPGRADYVHHVADLLAARNGGAVPRGPGVRVLDVGVGANCIYPLIGHHEYGWRFVGSDVDAGALRAAQQIVAANGALAEAIECRRQPDARRVFDGIVRPGEVFDATLCNPPFHASAAEAAAGTRRKTANLGTARGPRPVLNFGGQPAELWAPGGEAAFVGHLVRESQQRPAACFWYTTLISKKETLPGLHRALHRAGALAVQTIDMAQGQKKSRLVAWTFLTPAQQAAWRQARWDGG